MSERLVYPLLLMVAAGLAWTLATARREHRVVGALLSWQLAADVLRMAMDPHLHAAGPWPYSGATLCLYFVDHAVAMSVRFTILAAIVVHFARLSPLPIALAFVGALATLVVTKMTLGISLVTYHQGLSALTALACVLVIGWSITKRRETTTPDGAHAALLVLATTDLLNAIVHATHAFDAWWSELNQADTAAVALVLLGYVGALGREVAHRWRRAS